MVKLDIIKYCKLTNFKIKLNKINIISDAILDEVLFNDIKELIFSFDTIF
ncbi:hypothetical protein KX935_03165 [Streptobacillus moniliformis]|nr:hypothetical protein KX935_03165 [Streptobacillus moniliformis]